VTQRRRDWHHPQLFAKQWRGWLVRQTAFRRKSGGRGQRLLGDGSAQQVTSGSFRLNWLKNAEDSGNFTSENQYTTALGDSLALPVRVSRFKAFLKRHPQGCLFLFPASKPSAE
jgi:hypothetical protein